MSAVFNILVKVDAKEAKAGAEQVKGVLTELGGAASRATGAVAGLWAAFAIKDAIEGLGAVVQHYQDIQNKLRVVTNGTADLNNVSKETLSIALETRTAWSATVTLFSRISQNAQDLNLGQRQILDFTKQVNQAVVVSGATAQEAQAALIQLSQGMASGTLRGDELRSVMEQLPIVADVIAKKFGATRGELRALGREGKLSSKLIIEAFHEASADLEEKFGKTIPTLSQSWQEFGDRATEAIGKIDAKIGASRALTKLLDVMGQSVSLLGEGVSGAIGASSPVFDAVQDAEASNAAYEHAKKFDENMKHSMDRVADITKMVEGLQAAGVKITFPTELAGKITQLSVITNDLFGYTIPQDFDETAKHVAEVEKALDKLVEKEHMQQINHEAQLLWETQSNSNKLLEAAEDHWDKIRDKIRQSKNLLEALVKAGPPVPQAPGWSWQGGMGSAMNNMTTPSWALPQKSNDPWNQQGSGEYEENPLLASAMKKYTKQDAWEMIKSLTEATRELDNSQEFLGKRLTEVQKKFSEQIEKQYELKALLDAGKISWEMYTMAMGKAKSDGMKDFYTYSPNPQRQRTLDAKGDVNLEPKINQWGDFVKDSARRTGAEREAAMALREQALERKAIDLELEDLQARRDLEDQTKDLTADINTYSKAIEQQNAVIQKLTGPQQQYILHMKIITAAVRDNNLSEERAVVLRAMEYADYVKQDAVMSKLKGQYADHAAFVAQLDYAKAHNNITSAQYIRLLTEENEAMSKANGDKYDSFLAKKDRDKYGMVDGKVITDLRTQMAAFRDDILNTSDSIVTAIKGSADALSKMIVNAAETGKLAWRDMLTGMIHLMNELIVELLKAALLKALLTKGVGAGVPSLPGGGASVPGSDAWINGGGFASGGSYRVGGSGGPDSVRTVFDLTPGEMVYFQPPGGPVTRPKAGPSYDIAEYGTLIGILIALGTVLKAQSAANGNGSKNNRPSVSVHNHWDRRELLSALDTPEGHTAVVNVARKNPGVYGALLKK